MGALSHLRVLDLSRVLAGPWAGQILADLGAEVIKIERPGNGDDTRAWGPPFLKDPRGENTSEAAYYLSANRNKHSVTVDFTRPEGQKLVRELAARSDIVIENFKAGAMDFDDLLYKTNVLFRDHLDVLHKYQHRFRYLLVDEYQDTNYAQYLIVKKLAAVNENLCVVGDDAPHTPLCFHVQQPVTSQQAPVEAAACIPKSPPHAPARSRQCNAWR